MASGLHFRFASELSSVATKSQGLTDGQHLGGIHSGCGLSGLIWLLYKVIMNFIDTDIQHDAVLVTGTLTLVLVGLSALSAFPWIRNNHHK